MTGRICVDYKRISKIYCSRMEIGADGYSDDAASAASLAKKLAAA